MKICNCVQFLLPCSLKFMSQFQFLCFDIFQTSLMIDHHFILKGRQVVVVVVAVVVLTAVVVAVAVVVLTAVTA